jgi:peptidoglycan/LPS O-acetylase OafA/YrhL
METERRLNRLAQLTGFRGIAAYSVLVAHGLDTFFPVFHPFASRIAYFGMSLFFVLSGFVIHYNYAETFQRESIVRATYKFFVARFARLYPLYALAIISSLAILPSPFFLENPAAILAYITLTQSWFNMQMATFPPDWSISSEWFFYLAFVPLGICVARLPHPVRALASFCATVTLLLVPLFYFFQEPLTALVQRWLWQDAHISAGAWGWVIYFSPYVRVLEFIAGMLAAQSYLLLNQRMHIPFPAWVVLAACISWCGAVVFVGWVTETPTLANIAPNFIFAPALAPLLLCCCLYDTWLSRALSSRPLVFVGEISYSVYTWSFLVLTMLGSNNAAPASFNSTSRLIVSIVLTTIFAYGSYLLIEAPARRWLRLALMRRVPKRASSTPSPGRPRPI